MSENNNILSNNIDNISELEFYNHFESRIEVLEKWMNDQIKNLKSGLDEYADEMLDNIKLN